MKCFTITPKQFVEGDVFRHLQTLKDAKAIIKHNEKEVIRIAEVLLKQKRLLVESMNYLKENLDNRILRKEQEEKK